MDINQISSPFILSIIKFCSALQNLGMSFDPLFSFEFHASALSLYSALHLADAAAEILVQTFLTIHLEYCNSCFIGFTANIPHPSC